MTIITALVNTNIALLLLLRRRRLLLLLFLLLPLFKYVRALALQLVLKDHAFEYCYQYGCWSKQGGLPYAIATPLVHTLWNGQLIHRVWIARCLVDVYHHDLRHVLLHVYFALNANLRAGASAAL